MCLIAWNWQPHSATPLLLVANRDEFYARPSSPLHWWPNQSVLAGRDLQAGGSWLGLSRNGRMAALTNYRQPVADKAAKPSRGTLVADFLLGDMDASSYLADLAPRTDRYNPFNLLVFDGQQLMGLESRHQRVFAVAPGLGAVSNADFGTPWPKLVRLQAGLQKQCDARQTQVSDLLPLLQDRRTTTDAELPQTGVPLETERMLSAVFVASAHYGPRASSVLAVHQQGAHFFEQSYAEHGMLGATQQFFTP
ncbi:MAG: NRDE family protein [Rhodoferax sp.]|nr:NRDE family protein [Rhodoferax sp.]